jgi:hypothetical protein
MRAAWTCAGLADGTSPRWVWVSNAIPRTDYGFADTLEPGVFIGGEARLIAFGGVIHDTRGLGAPLRLGINV